MLKGEYCKHSTMWFSQGFDNSETTESSQPRSAGVCVCGVDGVRLTVLSPEGGRPGTREVLKVFVPLDSQRQHASLKSFSMFAVLCY